jgi:leader peptidase (prepilin peptidase)/N-methyltransferase
VIAFATCIAIGAVVGSLVSVVIDRVSRGESIVSPPPHCASCGTFLRPWDNIPIVGWVVLRGRCRHCAAFIPLQSFVKQLLCGGAEGFELRDVDRL